MKISYNWLREFIDLPETPEEVAHLLTMAGLEVESVEIQEAVPGSLEGVVIGEVVECRRHPNADRLSLTRVDLGGGRIVPIVCGAPNVALGQKVVVAQVGSTLHPINGEPFQIRKAKIRGEESEGMICAEDELGLGDGHSGILVLDTDLPNGTAARRYFKPDWDAVFEIGLTPNRADAASHLGVARDLKALLRRPLRLPDVSGFRVDRPGHRPFEVLVEAPEACPRYSGISISGIRIAESPEWLKKRLSAIGQTPINNVVDVTNYVLHALGQPLHAFDADRIAGQKVVVKTLPEGALFVTLDEKKRTLTGRDLMICDATEGMCMAGVFGGLHSGITDATRNIFLESAYFSPNGIRRTVLHHGLKTDSAFRFERGTDPNNTVFALKVAAGMIRDLAGGDISSEIVDHYPARIEAASIALQYASLDRLVGQAIDRAEIAGILDHLEIEIIERNDDGLVVRVPPYRVDVHREADLIEEILRIYGYDRVEMPAFASSGYMARFPAIDPGKERLKTAQLLAANGFHEIITNSLTSPAYAQLLPMGSGEPVRILNPLSEDLSELRSSLVFSGLEVIAHNINRRQKDLKFFEFGTVYRREGRRYAERTYLAIWMTGSAEMESWNSAGRPTTFHDIYSTVQKIIHKFIEEAEGSRRVQSELFETALELTCGKFTPGVFGILRTALTKAADVQQRVFYAEIDFDGLLEHNQRVFNLTEVSRYPEVRRDLSLVIDKSVSYEQIRRLSLEADPGGILKEINVFDVYEGESIGTGKKAYALSYILQDESKTLTDDRIEAVMQRLMGIYEKQIGAVIRK
jgi:phenylalanyl-tRNA synthetase beta chain